MARPNKLYPLDCEMGNLEKSQMYFPRFYCRTFSQIFLFMFCSRLCFAVFTRFGAALQNIFFLQCPLPSMGNLRCTEYHRYYKIPFVDCFYRTCNLHANTRYVRRVTNLSSPITKSQVLIILFFIRHSDYQLGKFLFELVFASRLQRIFHRRKMRDLWCGINGTPEINYLQNAVRPENDVSCGIRNALKFVGMNGMC